MAAARRQGCVPVDDRQTLLFLRIDASGGVALAVAGHIEQVGVHVALFEGGKRVVQRAARACNNDDDRHRSEG